MYPDFLRAIFTNTQQVKSPTGEITSSTIAYSFSQLQVNPDEVMGKTLNISHLAKALAYPLARTAWGGDGESQPVTLP